MGRNGQSFSTVLWRTSKCPAHEPARPQMPYVRWGNGGNRDRFCVDPGDGTCVTRSPSRQRSSVPRFTTSRAPGACPPQGSLAQAACRDGPSGTLFTAGRARAACPPPAAPAGSPAWGTAADKGRLSEPAPPPNHRPPCLAPMSAAAETADLRGGRGGAAPGAAARWSPWRPEAPRRRTDSRALLSPPSRGRQAAVEAAAGATAGPPRAASTARRPEVAALGG